MSISFDVFSLFLSKFVHLMRKLTLCLIQLSKALFRGLNMRSGAMIFCIRTLNFHRFYFSRLYFSLCLKFYWFLYWFVAGEFLIAILVTITWLTILLAFGDEGCNPASLGSSLFFWHTLWIKCFSFPLKRPSQ